MAMPPPIDPPRLLRRSARALSLYIILGSVALAALSCFALSRLTPLLEDPEVTPAAFAAWCVRHRALVMLAWLPAVVLALSALGRRGRVWVIVSLGLSLVLMIVPALLVLACFLLLIAPLYDYRPL